MVQETFSIRGRKTVAMAAIAAVFLLLAGGLFRLQIVQHERLAEQSENNRLRIVPIIPRRGLVYDRFDRVIIDNRPSYTVSVVPTEEVEGVTVPHIAELIGMDTLEIRKRIKRNMVGWYQPSLVKKDIPFEVVAVLEEQSAAFPGVSYHMERVRQFADSLGAEAFTGHGV
jgi:penicillin-binding protein 2